MQGPTIISYLSLAYCIRCVEFSLHTLDENGTIEQQLLTDSVQQEGQGWLVLQVPTVLLHFSIPHLSNGRWRKLDSEILMTQLNDKTCGIVST